ncbi:universal stress protein [Pseudomonas sp. PS02288]|uniref:universal stress protein n=1 Tax=Pseudomonas sp. PS02288 TaxID=2991443 RepID=UPI00249C3B83|nr:universal stress protein [Pseudomonas sp. PS02288]
MSQVLACIDASVSAPAVVDYAAWAALRMSASLSFLHVLDEQRYPHADLSGNIGLGSREALLNELSSLDAQRNRLALEDGRVLLQEARQRAHSAGVPIAETQQRHGDLLHSLNELQGDTQLLVMGRQGERSGGHALQIGSQLENVIRAVPRPILVAPSTFRVPRRLMLAFDGSVTARQAVETLASGALCEGMPIHLVMIGADTGDNWAPLDNAAARLAAAGYDVRQAIRHGEVVASLLAYQEEHSIDVLAMGAYGHSRIRQFLVGSTTGALLRSSSGALLILR